MFNQEYRHQSKIKQLLEISFAAFASKWLVILLFDNKLPRPDSLPSEIMLIENAVLTAKLDTIRSGLFWLTKNKLGCHSQKWLEEQSVMGSFLIDSWGFLHRIYHAKNMNDQLGHLPFFSAPFRFLNYWLHINDRDTILF